MNSKKSLRRQTKNSCKRRNTKKIPKQDETIYTKQDVPNQRKKFYQKLGEQWTKPYQQQDAREARRIWIKKLEISSQKFDRINNTETELQVLEEDAQGNIYPEGVKVTKDSKLENPWPWCPNQLLTHNVSTGDVENTIGTN